MAVGILHPMIQETHNFHHDLESVYWVLLWCILRHTNHNMTKDRLSHLFDTSTDEGLSNAKHMFLSPFFPYSLVITDNPALTKLLEDLRTAFYLGSTSQERSQHRVTASQFLGYLDDALKKDWPTNDAAIPFERPRTSDAYLSSAFTMPRTSTKRKESADPQPSTRLKKSRKLGSFAKLTAIVAGLTPIGTTSRYNLRSKTQKPQPESSRMTRARK